MGAHSFITPAAGATAGEAFSQAVQDACWEHGYGGYTGTIAEKDEFVMIPLPEGQDALVYAEQLIRDDDKRIRDKWGPAGCIKSSDGNWLFFGYASS